MGENEELKATDTCLQRLIYICENAGKNTRQGTREKAR
jgi:hypothetical protein